MERIVPDRPAPDPLDPAATKGERLFTANEVQAVIEAVILYERVRSESLMRQTAAAFDAAIRANRKGLSRRTHKTLDEIRRNMNQRAADG